jgi:hypothetical protein
MWAGMSLYKGYSFKTGKLLHSKCSQAFIYNIPGIFENKMHNGYPVIIRNFVSCIHLTARPKADRQ